MAYRSATSGDASATAVAKQLSNLGVTKATGTEATIQFLSGIGEDKIELNAGEYDAAVAFFEQRDYDRQAAESIAYVLMRQAKIDEVSVFKILDTLKAQVSVDPVTLNNLVGEILNLNRFKTSILGYKSAGTENTLAKRNIKA